MRHVIDIASATFDSCRAACQCALGEERIPSGLRSLEQYAAALEGDVRQGVKIAAGRLIIKVCRGETDDLVIVNNRMSTDRRSAVVVEELIRPSACINAEDTLDIGQRSARVAHCDNVTIATAKNLCRAASKRTANANRVAPKVGGAHLNAIKHTGIAVKEMPACRRVDNRWRFHAETSQVVAMEDEVGVGCPSEVIND